MDDNLNQEDEDSQMDTNKMDKRILKKRMILVTSNVIGTFFYLLDSIADLMNASIYLRYDNHFREGLATLIFIFLPIIVQMFLATASLKLGKAYQGTGAYLLSVQWLDEEPTIRTIVMHYVLRLIMMEPVYSTYVAVRLQWNTGKSMILEVFIGLWK